MMLDLIIVSYNGKELTKQAIESAINNSIKPNKIVLVDNNSTDGSVEYIKHSYNFVECISLPYNAGYGKAINIGFNRTNSNYVVISNNDVIFPHLFFEKILNVIPYLGNDFGVLGCQQVYIDGSFQNSYGRYHTLLSAFLDVFLYSLLEVRVKKFFWKHNLNQKLKKVDYVDGAIFCVNRHAFESINGFDEDFFFYSEEVDLCKRMHNNGFSIWFDPNNEVIHYRGQGKNKKLGLSVNSVPTFVKSRSLYCRKHLGKLKANLYLFLEALFYFEIFCFFLLKKVFLGSKCDEQLLLTHLISKEFFKEGINFIKTKKK